MTRDNKITNKLVRSGKLPKSQMEIYSQNSAPKRLKTKMKPQVIKKVRKAVPLRTKPTGMQMLSKAMKPRIK